MNSSSFRIRVEDVASFRAAFRTCAVVALALGAFAISPSRAQDLPRPVLGIAMNNLDRATSVERGIASGIIVIGVAQGQAAHKAGVRPLDIVTAVDGRPVNNMDDLQTIVRSGIPGLPVSLTIDRDGKPMSIKATLSAQADPPPPQDESWLEQSGSAAMDSGRHEAAGAAFVTLNPTMASALNLRENARGAVVLAVDPGSSANEAGLKRGDIVLAVNGRRTTSALAVAEQFIRGVNASNDPESFYVRRGQNVYVAGIHEKPQGFAQKWGVLYQLAGRVYASGNDWIVRWDWLDRGKTLYAHVRRPDTDMGTTNLYTMGENGVITHYVGALDANGQYTPKGTQWTVNIEGNVVDLRSGNDWTRNTYLPNGDSFTWTQDTMKKSGKVASRENGSYRPVDRAEIQRLAVLYKQTVAQQMKQQAAQRAEEQARRESGGGGLFGALGGATLGALAGGNTEQIMGAAMKGAAIVDPNMAALDQVGDAMISGNANALNTTSALGMAGQSQSGGGSYPTRPNALNGSAACSMMNQSNYREVGLSGGNDVQLKTMCAQAYEYYSMYLNAIRQGYSESDANRTYAAHEGAAQNAISFYQSAR